MQPHLPLRRLATWPPRIRARLARHPRVQWFAIMVVATCAGLACWGHLAALDSARAAWGRTTAVWVADADTASGLPFTARSAMLPEALVPAGAVRAASHRAPDLVHAPIAAGQIVMRHHVDPPDHTPPAGWRLVTLVEAVPSGARTGDRVDLAADGTIVAVDGLVVAVTADTMQVAVPAQAAATAAFAAERGNLSVLRHP